MWTRTKILGDTIDEDNLFVVDLHINLKVKRYNATMQLWQDFKTEYCFFASYFDLKGYCSKIFAHRTANTLQKRYANLHEPRMKIIPFLNAYIFIMHLLYTSYNFYIYGSCFYILILQCIISSYCFFFLCLACKNEQTLSKKSQMFHNYLGCTVLFEKRDTWRVTNCCWIRFA